MPLTHHSFLVQRLLCTTNDLMDLPTDECFPVTGGLTMSLGSQGCAGCGLVLQHDDVFRFVLYPLRNTSFALCQPWGTEQKCCGCGGLIPEW